MRRYERLHGSEEWRDGLLMELLAEERKPPRRPRCAALPRYAPEIALSVAPPALDELAVAAEVLAEGEDLKALVSRLEGPHRLG